ncbi:secA translation regulator SecM [Methylomonas sp. AM2-LC]|uniref:YcbK family protein n=1 Tax=Methylomonas sp. AM2-LC TaxID=3153301 RepID=UPI003263643D
MFRSTKECNIHPQNETIVARRNFFSRLAFGVAASIALPNVVQAAKNTAENTKINHQAAKKAVRLPKHTTQQANNASRIATSSSKKATSEQKHLNVSGADHPHAQHNNRVKTVYNSKTQVPPNKNHTQVENGRSHSIIQPRAKTSMSNSASNSVLQKDHVQLITQRSLAFQNPHTGDKLSLTYYEQGRYLDDALNEISFLLRDHHSGEVHPIDPELLDQLHEIKQMLGLKQPFDIVCGYRSPLTNAKLHAESVGVANNSFHIHGRAIDIRIERYSLSRIHNAALAMHRGGVGYYPESNFIHLDTGTFRNWTL